MVIHIMNIVKKNNHYIIELKFIPGETIDLKYIYTPDYFEDLGFFTNITVYPSSIQTGGGDTSIVKDIVQDKTITFPYNIFVKIVTFFSKDLATFDFSKANELWKKSSLRYRGEVEEPFSSSSSSDFFHNVNESLKIAFDKITSQLRPGQDEPIMGNNEKEFDNDFNSDVESKSNCKENVISEQIHQEDFFEPSNYEKIVIDLEPFDSEGRILEDPIRFRDFIKNRLKKRDERIENNTGLTYNESLHWLDMLKKQRVHRMNKLLEIKYIENDMFILDGRLVVLGRYFDKDNDTADVRNSNIVSFKAREKELVGYKELEGVRLLDDIV